MNPKTQEILDLFYQIAAVPRCTKKEARISAWLKAWGESHGFKVLVDEALNLVIQAPASPGHENSPAIVIQGHMDMVCDKAPEVQHDFDCDPIRPILDGDWLRTGGTTLGADNGIGLALGMAAALDPDLVHPPLELLMTVDEEEGMSGAKRLQPDFVHGRVMLNIDTEDEGIFIIGCAGGVTTHIDLPLHYGELPAGYQTARLQVSGLQGGHSGLHIHLHRANANRLLARILYTLPASLDLRLLALHGGSAHNAIARDAWADVAFIPSGRAELEKALTGFESQVRNEFAATESGIAVRLVEAAPQPQGAIAEKEAIVRMLLALPHGVAEMSATIPGFVETSNNLAVVEVKDGRLHVITSQRSSVDSRLVELTGRVEAAASLAGASFVHKDDYPGWEPAVESALLNRCTQVYAHLFGKDPQVMAIHAGLECGWVGAKYPGMDMISFGPTLQMPHSPSERLYVPSLEKVWAFMAELLKSYSG